MQNNWKPFSFSAEYSLSEIIYSTAFLLSLCHCKCVGFFYQQNVPVELAFHTGDKSSVCVLISLHFLTKTFFTCSSFSILIFLMTFMSD